MRRMRWLMLAFLAAMVLLAWLHPGAFLDDDAVMHRPDARVPSLPSVDQRPALPPVVDAPADADVVTPPVEEASARDEAALPPEVADTLALIDSGGPFPHDRDGLVFGNFEGRLPKRKRGWYHE